jgi:DNA-directed RNA polymerase subunit RPC12/RpoP
VLNVTKQVTGQVTTVNLEGGMEAGVELDKLIGIPAGELRVNCRGIQRINSIGVKAWLRFFQSVREANRKIVFQECSIALVEQFNSIANFACGGTVESFYLPYMCEDCGKDVHILQNVETFKRAGSKVADTKCPHCGGAAVFDDLPEEYLRFLGR